MKELSIINKVYISYKTKGSFRAILRDIQCVVKITQHIPESQICM